MWPCRYLYFALSLLFLCSTCTYIIISYVSLIILYEAMPCVGRKPFYRMNFQSIELLSTSFFSLLYLLSLSYFLVNGRQAIWDGIPVRAFPAQVLAIRCELHAAALSSLRRPCLTPSTAATRRPLGDRALPLYSEADERPHLPNFLFL